jgi:hypothetical protein
MVDALFMDEKRVFWLFLLGSVMYEVTLVTGNSHGGFLVTSALWTTYLGGKQLPLAGYLPFRNYPDKFWEDDDENNFENVMGITPDMMRNWINLIINNSVFLGITKNCKLSRDHA